jgi:excisionase family DNA binding protein
MKFEPLMTMAEACAYIRRHRNTIMRYVRDGRLPCKRAGYDYRFRREDLDKFLGRQ